LNQTDRARRDINSHCGESAAGESYRKFNPARQWNFGACWSQKKFLGTLGGD
jgi:hypothetical protein